MKQSKTPQSDLLRPTLLDSLSRAGKDAKSNKYCDKAVLVDESSVETFFINRLLKDLGYKDSEIRPKVSLKEIVVARGRKKEGYRPDYVIYCNEKPMWLIDAKSPGEDIDKWAFQGAGYALGLNQEFSNQNPCSYYVITNGLAFDLYKWDESKPIISLEFSDFADDNISFFSVRSLLQATTIRQGLKPSIQKPRFLMKKPSVEEIKRVFNSCHRLIWKAEKMNPQPAFFEFVKIMFVKLWEDRKLHDDPIMGPLLRDEKPIPRDNVIFSTHWIDALQSQGVKNPVDETLFARLNEVLREDVARGKKKPIFGPNDHIELQIGTIRQVVSKLESLDLYSIDEDLNGRLFETFLSATMRGQALGQYFTPRSIVKMMEQLAAPIASKDHIDHVIDACCGSGGFLIEALTDMRNQIRSNTSLSDSEQNALLERVANDSIFGIDAGKEPPLAKISRINMYLHGDGGSRIYAADSLDKTVSHGVGDDQQSRFELEELQKLIFEISNGSRRGFDIVLTNPPFSMDYSETLPDEALILNQYALRTFGFGKTNRQRPSLKSSIMFLERYADILKPGGKLVTVIDDSILSSSNNRFARDFIRDRFIVRAVISIPGDAFQRVGARAKTSVLYLIRRDAKKQSQPDAFMYECRYVGLDDVPMKTRPSKAAEARTAAEDETRDLFEAFNLFMQGIKGPWRVRSGLIGDRLDVKSCLPRPNDISDKWRADGLNVVPLHTIVDKIENEGFNPKNEPSKLNTLLRVRYDGIPEEGDKALGEELTYSKVQNPKENDIVASNIAAALGSIAVIPADLSGVIASSEFTIMRLKDARFDVWFLWGFLRSPEVRARLLSQSTGISRHRVEWDDLGAIPVPVIPIEKQRLIGKQFYDSVKEVRNAEKKRADTSFELNQSLDLSNEWAVQRLKAAKPPK
ncbi:MAG: N-6 DNA methylase [Actinomycetota bacterium]